MPTRQLPPVFRSDGSVTAANSISDGAAALVLMRESNAENRGTQPLAAMVERQSPDALRVCKKLIQFPRSGFSADALAAERALFLELFAGKNQSEGVDAFLAKRPPKWRYGE